LISPKIRIGIDAHASEKEGTGNCTYIRNFLLALQAVDLDNEYILYSKNSRHPFYAGFKNCPNFTVKSFPVRNQYIRVPLFLALASLKDSLDILHVQYNSPPFHRGKLVVTIHDLCFLRFPGFFSRLQGVRLKVLTRLTARKARRIITGSLYSKNDIMKNYKIDTSKISVVPYGVSGDFGPQEKTSKMREILDKYRIPDRYLLCVGRLNPRKNLISLVDAFGRLKLEKKIPHKLVIVGIEDFSATHILRSVEDIVGEDVIFTGYVDEADLPSVYSGADVFVYPSLFEGVGLPVLEAMRSGIPVVTSNTTSLREIVGDAAITVDPLDVEALSKAIWKLIENVELKAEYVRKGHLRSQDFLWEETARKTVDIYRDVSKEK
jgi:glycosyltransferase involved in cell wall biosynthesis